MGEKTQVIVVGGGASGLAAAIAAAENGAAVTLLEQNENPGRKICVTGNGRCNLTNRDMRPDIFRGQHPEFVEEILAQFTLEDTLAFFEKLGVAFTERNGWLYPRSNQAKCIPELLILKARALKVKIKTREHAESVSWENGRWKVETSGWTYEGDKVILANGSKASQVPGSDGSGYELAANLGHHIIRPLPALTGLRCKGNVFSAWAGVRTDAKVTLLIDGKRFVEESGEVQLTDYGISGIPRTKCPNSEVAGQANTFIFPDINAGNIGYKIAQRLGNFDAYGPILLGLNAPINDLSRGCNAEEVYSMAIITAALVED